MQAAQSVTVEENEMYVDDRISIANLSMNHKKDLLWKPLIRMFRRFLKKDALSLDTYE